MNGRIAFLVVTDDYAPMPIGVFDDRALADAYAEAVRAAGERDPQIIEFPLNAPPDYRDGLTPWYVWGDRDGDLDEPLAWAGMGAVSDRPIFTPTAWGPIRARLTVWARDRAGAAALASEQHAALIAAGGWPEDGP